MEQRTVPPDDTSNFPQLLNCSDFTATAALAGAVRPAKMGTNRAAAKKIWRRMSHMASAGRHVFANPRKEMTMTPRLNPFTVSPAAMQP
jgi:hypothetical protein